MRRWSLLTCAGLLLGCPGTGAAPAPPADRLEFETVTRERTLGGCVPERYECAYVRLEYPVVVVAPEGYAVTAAADAVSSLLVPEPGPDGWPQNADALVQGFLDDSRESEKEEPEDAVPWFLERRVFVVHNTPEVLSLGLTWTSFAGGVHGMTETHFRTLDPRTGRGIGLAEVLVDGYEDRLLPLAEARFRELHSVEEGSSLADAGFVFDDDTFTLADNVRIDGKGLTFYYNLYEVAPYSFGPTELVFAWDELAGLLREGVERAVEADPTTGEPEG